MCRPWANSRVPSAKRVFHGVMVEQLVGLGADLAAALALGRDRPGVLDPAATSRLWISQSSMKLPLSQVKFE